METLKLKRANRLTYRGTMYVKDKPFNCSEKLAEDLLSKKDGRERSLFVRCIVKKASPQSAEVSLPVVEEIEPPPQIEVVDEDGTPVVEDSSPLIEEIEDEEFDSPEEVSEDEISEAVKVEV